MADLDKHPRLILDKFLTENECKELEFIHKSCCTVGYRPYVFSTTILHLIATKSAHLIMPFIPIRDRLKDIVEDHFGCEYELFVEFTGLISWCKGSSIGWHSDDNRDYLKQRDFAVVCYLNTYGVDFEGGLFHFQDGDHRTIVPMAGDVIIYTADERNVHAVDELRVEVSVVSLHGQLSTILHQFCFTNLGCSIKELLFPFMEATLHQYRCVLINIRIQITKGERTTLTLWFSRSASHDEDAKILKSLCERPEYNSIKKSVAPCFPIQASSNMYWFPPEEASKFQSGFDIRIARLHVLWFDVCTREKECISSLMDSSHFLNLLENPLYLVHGDKLIVRDFVNLLHALQVLQFYQWKGPQLKIFEATVPSVDVEPLSELSRDFFNRLKTVLVKDLHLADTLFGHVSGGNGLQGSFDIKRFSAAVSEWEAYAQRLHNKMVVSIRYWKQSESIFPVHVC